MHFFVSEIRSSAPWQSIYYDDNKTVAIVYDSNIGASSEDSTNGAEKIMPSTNYWYSICYGEDKCVAITKKKKKVRLF